MDFISWDYDTGIATRYTRVGECNQCGECCQHTISLVLIDGDKYTNGGVSTDEKENWSEIDHEDQEITREFVKLKYKTPDTIENFPFQEHHRCSMLDLDNDCMMHDNDKPWICTIWPTQPRDLKNFLGCSYSFEEKESWEISKDGE